MPHLHVLQDVKVGDHRTLEPVGRHEELKDVDADKIYTIVEGSGIKSSARKAFCGRGCRSVAKLFRRHTPEKIVEPNKSRSFVRSLVEPPAFPSGAARP